MTDSQVDEYEAWLMNPERWRNLTPEEQEKYTRSLAILKHREEKLREYADDAAFAKILNSGR